MKFIRGKRLIAYVLDRVSRCQTIDRLVLATTDDPSDDALAHYTQSLGYPTYRGSVDDVLARFYLAAKPYARDLEAVVRVTGDCPLLSPVLCDQLIRGFLRRKADYGVLGPSYAEGMNCEVFTYKALAKAHRFARLQSEREHVTPYLTKRKDLFRTWVLDQKRDDSAYRIVVDEPEDFSVVKAIIENLPVSKTYTFRAIKHFLDRHPDLRRRNAHVIRNEGLLISLKKDKVVTQSVLKKARQR